MANIRCCNCNVRICNALNETLQCTACNISIAVERLCTALADFSHVREDSDGTWRPVKNSSSNSSFYTATSLACALTSTQKIFRRGSTALVHADVCDKVEKEVDQAVDK